MEVDSVIWLAIPTFESVHLERTDRNVHRHGRGHYRRYERGVYPNCREEDGCQQEKENENVLERVREQQGRQRSDSAGIISG